VTKPQGDILVTDQGRYYAVQGFLPNRHSYFDPRISGYKIISGAAGAAPSSAKGESRGERRRGGKKSGKSKGGGNYTFEAPTGGWLANIPLTGNAMAKADDKLLIAGSIVQHPVGQFEKLLAGYEGREGNVLWIASATDGNKLAQYALDAAPAWDGIAVVDGKVLVSLKNGTIVCFGGE
jgi:hypothetical protein